MKKRKEDIENNVLTQKMDFGTQGFDDFQTILLNKSRKQTESQKRKIDLLAIKYQMEDYLVLDVPEVKSAGEFLKLILKTLKIKQNQFAAYLGLKPSNLSKLISGERTINYDLALIFGRLFNIDPMLWIEIQAKDELSRLLHAERRNYSGYSLNDLLNEQQKVV